MNLDINDVRKLASFAIQSRNAFRALAPNAELGKLITEVGAAGERVLSQIERAESESTQRIERAEK